MSDSLKEGMAQYLAQVTSQNELARLRERVIEAAKAWYGHHQEAKLAEAVMELEIFLKRET
jgi:hypothetical protein